MLQHRTIGVVATIVLGACHLCFADTMAPTVNQEWFVTSPSFGDTDAVFRIMDINGDGDALDLGEPQLFADGFDLVFAIESNGDEYLVTDIFAERAYLLRDINNDGDALDLGERTVWADGLTDVRAIKRGFNGEFYIATFNVIWRLNDKNGDGDALDLGERTLFADNFDGAYDMIVQTDRIYVSEQSTDAIRLVRDVNGDGDALDLGENTLYSTGFGTPAGILMDDDTMYVASSSNNRVWKVADVNGDDDALDLGEVRLHADDVFSGLDAPLGLSAHPAGGILVTGNVSNDVWHARDVNGDGDALDLGENVVFADNIPLAAFIIGRDRDGDRVIDGLDNCPMTANADQADQDNDGAGDACDQPGDLNGDGCVSQSDLGILLAAFNVNGTGDLDGDNDTDQSDLGILLANFGEGCR